MDLSRLPLHLAERVRPLGARPSPPRFVVYWMRTGVRAHENPALDVALAAADAAGVGCVVYHAVSERYPYASDRHHTFLLEGARDVEAQLARRGIGYVFHLERPGHRAPVLRTLGEAGGLVVTEDMPVQPLRAWTRRLARTVPVLAVDTACVAPMRASRKAPSRAFAFRKATQALWDARLEGPWPERDDPSVPFVPAELPFEPLRLADADLPALVAGCEIDHAVGAVPHTPGGSAAGYARWGAFVAEGRLRRYDRLRNDPTKPGASRMSAYFHYGMVSPRRIAQACVADGSRGALKYLDELLTWRELAYAFCFHVPEHDRLAALPAWARETLDAHRDDRRQARSWERLARGRTGDRVWDACQRSLLIHGELHNNVRMTWGKALPRWTSSPEEALRQLVDLNHRYALDGRDPASYGGLLWCLGLFDRPFPPTPILGRVRSRSTERHAQRFDLAAYEAKVRTPARADAPRVAVVGAGIAGLACARVLADHGLSVEIFDKGRGVAGRMSTRRQDDARFDHGAQYFTARDPRFRRYVTSWVSEGVVAPWDGRFARLGPAGPVPEALSAPRYVGAPSMSTVAGHLAAELTVHTGVEVAPLEETAEPRHRLRGTGGALLGAFDVVLLTAPAPQSERLLPMSSGLRPGVARASLAPCWAVLLRFPEAFDPGFDAAKVHPACESPLAWIAWDGAKPGRAGAATWVLHAAPAWSELHLEDERPAVADALAEAFAALVPSAPPPVDRTAHRWRHAKTLKPLGTPCLFDPGTGLGVAGDFCLGAKVEAAFLSGVALAGRVLGASLELPPVQDGLFAHDETRPSP